jgi:hypothetical protein
MALKKPFLFVALLLWTAPLSCLFEPTGSARKDGSQTCGNGVIEGNEECDSQDLNQQTCETLGASGGTLTCTVQCTYDLTGCQDICGNDIKESNEECDGADLGAMTCADLGHRPGQLACTSDCTYDVSGCGVPPNCGDGVVDTDEECDDGADGDPCDGCLDDCTTIVNNCGDGFVCGNEQCDDGADGDPCDGCLDDCTTIVNNCGDGFVCGDEQCDDGANGDPCDGCLDDCTTIVNNCGDGFVCGNEQCDDGVNANPCDGCLDDCSRGWAKRIKITADHTDIDADLFDFPLLVYLSDSSGRADDDLSFVFDEIGTDANRKKIAVTTANGTTPCQVEIERWDNGAKKAWLWVRAPVLNSNADTEFYLYYDSSRADNDTQVGDPNSPVAQSVWEDDFVLVTHMQNDPDNQHIRDSSENNNDGTKGAAINPHQVEGIIGFAQRWDYNGQASEYIDIPHAASLNMGDTFTAQLWVDFELGNDPDNYERMLCKKSEWTSDTGWEFSLETNYNDRLTVRGSSGTGTACADDVVSSWSSGGWHHLVVVYENTTATVYCDGVQRDTCAIAAVNDSDESLGIGRYGAANKAIHHWYGRMDEIRLSRISRPAAWIKADYESQRDDLLDFSVEEVCFAP